VTFNFKVTHFFAWPLLSHLLKVIELSSFFVSEVFWVDQSKNIIPDLLPATLDLQLQGHAPFHVTFAISPSTSDRTVIFFLFLRFFGSINLKTLSLTFYLLRLTFNFKVTHLFTWQSIPTVRHLPITFHSNNFYNTLEEMVKLFFVFYQCSKGNVINSRTSQYVCQFFRLITVSQTVTLSMWYKAQRGGLHMCANRISGKFSLPSDVWGKHGTFVPKNRSVHCH
jgi:hypothetical protein